MKHIYSPLVSTDLGNLPKQYYLELNRAYNSSQQQQVDVFKT
jgi:hypothetical protein